MSRNEGRLWIMACAATLALAPLAMAQDMTGGAVTDPPAPIVDGYATLTGTYTNLGPAAAEACTIDYWFSIQPETWEDDGFNAMVASGEFSDSNDNQAFVYIDGNLCSHWIFELGEPSAAGDLPMYPIPANEGGTWSVELPVIPMEGITAGRVVVTEPESLRNSFEVNMPQWTNYPQIWHHAGALNLVSVGGLCDEVEACGDLAACFGTRLWAMDPVEAEVQVGIGNGVNWPAAEPEMGCGTELVDFTAGKIAIMRRGECTFFEKAQNAYLAGAAGAIIANSTNCSDDPLGDPEECVLTMGATAGSGYLIGIPLVMMGHRQGEELITALQGGETVRVAMGAIPGDTMAVYAWMFEAADPVIDNDLTVTHVPIGLIFFSDGFESGDTSAWSATVP